MNSHGIESQIFTWEKWDILDTMDFQFYSCRLLVPIFENKIGDEISCIEMSYSRSEMVLYDNEVTEIGRYKLMLGVH